MLGVSAMAFAQPGDAADAEHSGPQRVTQVAPAPALPADRPVVRSTTFAVLAFAVDGNSVLLPEDVQAVLAPFTGMERTVADVDRARDALQSAYHRRGYQTVSVSIAPESRRTLAEGLIVLTVTEGRIRKLNVTGTEYSSVERIRAQVPSLREGGVPNFNDVQADLAALNQQRDRQITPNVNVHEASGGLDVDLAVSETLPLHGLVEVNNRYSNGTTKTRALAMVSWDNARQRGDSVSVMVQTSPEDTDEGTVLFGSYLLRTQTPGFSVQFTALETESDVAALGGFSVVGAGQAFGIKGNWQLEDIAGWQCGFSAGAEYKNFLNRVVQQGGGSIDSPLTYVPVGLSLSANRRDGVRALQWSLETMMTLPGVGSDSWEIGDQNRFGAARQMHWLRAAVDWSTDSESGQQFAASLALQATDVPLVSNEQFSAGGMDSVRGFLEAETTGDVGAVVSLEYRLAPFATQFPSATRTWLDDGRAYVFLDSARLELTGRLPAGQNDRTELYAVGAGASLDFFSHFHAVAEWAVPLVDGPYTAKNDSRLLFRLWGTF